MDADDQLRLVEDFTHRLDQLEAQATRMSRKAVNDSVGALMGDLKKAYGRYKDSGGELGGRTAGVAAQRLSDIIDISEDLMKPEQVDQWKEDLGTFLGEADTLGQTLSAMLGGQPETNPIRVGVREQVEAAAESASKWLDYESEKTRKGVVGLVTMGVTSGWGAKRLADEMIRQMPQLHGQIEKIVRTEMATAYLEAQKRMTKRLNYEFVRWVATEDERTCPHCSSRSGLIFQVDEVVMPAHPLCRCAMVPVPDELVKGKDAELLNEEAWGEHRESVAREFLLNKIRKFPKAKPPWTIDRVLSHFDKHRVRPTPFEKIRRPTLGDTDSARPYNVLGDDADPGISWQNTNRRGPRPPGDPNNPLFGIGNTDRESTGEMYNVAPPANRSLDQRQDRGRQAQSSAVGTAGLQKLGKQADDFNAELQRKGEAQRGLFTGEGDAAQHKKTSVAAQKAGEAKLRDMKPGMDKIYEKARQTPLTAAQIGDLVDGVQIKGASAGEIKGIRSNLKEFVEVFNGGGITKAGANRVKSINVIDGKGGMDELMGQSTFNSATGEVTIPRQLMQSAKDGGKALLWHEMGHAMEVSDPSLLKRQLDWIKGRSPDTGPTFFQSGYSQDDLTNAYRDKFINSYVGHVYEEAELPKTMTDMDRLLAVMEDSENVEAGKPRKLKYKEFATESISVGVEYFSSPQGRAELWARDRDLFDLIMDLTQEDWG